MRLPAFLLALGLTTANAADPVWRHEPVEPDEHPDVAYIAWGTGASLAIIGVSLAVSLGSRDPAISSLASSAAYWPTLAVSGLVTYFFGKDFGLKSLATYLLTGFVAGSAVAHGLLMDGPQALKSTGWRSSSFVWGAVLSFAVAPALLEFDPFELRHEPFAPQRAGDVPITSAMPCAPGPGL